MVKKFILDVTRKLGSVLHQDVVIRRKPIILYFQTITGFTLRMVSKGGAYVLLKALGLSLLEH